MSVSELQALKINLVRQILDIENPALIQRLQTIVSQESSDVWQELSEIQKEEVEIGLRQIEEGKTISWEELQQKIS
ncbi:MAG: hypothetical protein AAFQ98_05655 [Bacteroidota bacterium]